jgi:oxazoline/thiazoline dehydrogenase
MSAQTPLLSFRGEVSLGETMPPEAFLELPHARISIGTCTPGLVRVVQMLSSGGATEDDLSAAVLETDGPAALAPLYYRLERWGEACLLRYIVEGPDGPLAIVEPMTAGFTAEPLGVHDGTRVRLSRFAYLRRDGDMLLLESPLSNARVVLPGSVGGGLVIALSDARSLAELSQAVDGMSAESAEAFIGLAVSAGVVTEVGNDGSVEDHDTALSQWEFHDLLFHSRSRKGRHDYPFGGTFPFLDWIEPLPAVKPQMSNDAVPLAVPDIERLERDDVSFTSVLERRRSIRAFGDPPITATQLGEFLYRVARVRSIVERNPEGNALYDVSRRPYPSGGATYDLEIYVTVNSCVGVTPALYHYDPLGHQLHRIAERNAQVDGLLYDARASAGLATEPQVLITLASRFQRLSWKYRSMAYATTLKNVGVLYQTMYLVATAMGLAPCGLGGGNSDLFARAAGTDYFAESSVGEFLLGTVGRDDSSSAPES